MNIAILFKWGKFSISKQLLNNLFRKNKTKIFSYDARDIGKNLILEGDKKTRSYYMTSLQAGVQLGDCVRINHTDEIATYQIQKIEYYTEPVGMWMANLLKI